MISQMAQNATPQIFLRYSEKVQAAPNVRDGLRGCNPRLRIGGFEQEPKN